MDVQKCGINPTITTVSCKEPTTHTPNFIVCEKCGVKIRRRIGR